MVAALKAKAPAWVAVDTAERARLLRACIPTTRQAADEGAAVEERLKGSYGGGRAEAMCVCKRRRDGDPLLSQTPDRA